MKIKVVIDHLKNQTSPQGAKKVSFAACLLGKLNLAWTIQASRIDYTSSVNYLNSPRKFH